jgi:hypothetical protein
VKRRWAERIFSLFLMALAASAYFQTLNLPKLETKTGLFTGPAFFPQWLSILLFLCSVIIFIKTYLLPRGEAENLVLPSFRAIFKVFAFLGVIALTIITIPFTGWLVAQSLLVLLIEMVFEKRNWARAIFISGATAGCIYLIFELGLGIRLPRGFFE